MGERISCQNRLDLNRCTAGRLSAVTGIGADTANRIVAYRRRKQRLASVGDVLGVRGVNEKDLQILRQTTQVHRLPTSPQAPAAKARQTVRRAATKPAMSPKKPNGRSQPSKARTSKKGTQTALTGVYTGKRVNTRVAASKKSKKKTVDLPRGRVARQPSKKRKTVQTRKGHLKRSYKTTTRKFDSNPPSGFSTPAKTRKSSPASLLMCREAQRLKASEGLDYVDNHGSPRPFLVLSSQRAEGVHQARAQINNCAVTVHLSERSPLMSPMVTVNIPSSMLAESSGVVACVVEEQNTPASCVDTRSSPKSATASYKPDEDSAVVSLSPAKRPRMDAPTQSSPAKSVTKDRNSPTKMVRMQDDDEAMMPLLRGSPEKALTDDNQGGYVAGSDTDHTTPDGDAPKSNNQGSLTSRTPAPPTEDRDGNLEALSTKEDLTRPDVMPQLSGSTGRRRRTRSRKKTAEKVQLWLENSSCSSNYLNSTHNDIGGENKQVAPESLMSGIAPLLPTTPVEDELERPGCNRQLERELRGGAGTPLTPAGGVSRKDKSVQTPPCSCRSCRRKRRARRRSDGAARERCDQPMMRDSFSPVAKEEELHAAWCSLL